MYITICLCAVRYVFIHLNVCSIHINTKTHTHRHPHSPEVYTHICICAHMCVLETYSIKNLRPSFYYNLKVHCVFPFEILNDAFYIKVTDIK